MEMFRKLGLKVQVPFEKHPQRETVDAEESHYHDEGEKPRWTRPKHKIERNLEMQKKGKKKAKA